MTGIRKREAFELTWDRVHLDKGIVTITAKGGRVRHVALSDDAFALLGRMPRFGARVFATTNWRQRFDRAKMSAGVPDLRWHDLRHSFATWRGQGGASLDVIRDALGHSSITVTQKYRPGRAFAEVLITNNLLNIMYMPSRPQAPRRPRDELLPWNWRHDAGAGSRTA